MEIQMHLAIAACVVVLSFFVTTAVSAQSQDGTIELIREGGEVAELVLETFLAPGEFPGRLFAHISKGQEAVFSLDSSLGGIEPFAELHPERLHWPQIAGLDLVVEGPPLRLSPAGDHVTDEALDAGFEVRWILEPLGQRLYPKPHFSAKVIEAKVLALGNRGMLLYWRASPPQPICCERVSSGHPNCDVPGVSREARALALSPDGSLLAMAVGGLRPRIEVWDVDGEPRLAWQSLFGADSGGAQEVAFSADAKWIVALTGKGRMHRFDSSTGGRHLSIPSAGRAARAIPPGRIMAVAGDAGEVNLWYLADGTIAWRLPPRQVRGPIDRLAASGDGKRFATLEYSEESTVVRVWEMRNRTLLAQIDVDPYAIVDIALDAKGEFLFVAHEKKGLLKTGIKKGSELKPTGGKNGLRCKGRLQWISGLDLLNCSVSGGEIQIDLDGQMRNELETGVQSSDWIAASSAGGRRMAAVGGGHLLVWWTDKALPRRRRSK
jgi:WD40 repeat protein